MNNFLLQIILTKIKNNWVMNNYRSNFVMRILLLTREFKTVPRKGIGSIFRSWCRFIDEGSNLIKNDSFSSRKNLVIF